MGAQALILLDNSLSVGRGNLAVCRETIKYLADNARPDIDFALSIYGEDIGVLSDYGEDRSALLERLYSVELTDRETYLTDNLASLLLEWKKADFADRCIILFSDGEDAAPIDHEKEELYFLLAKLDYPVFAVQCINDKNASIKTLSAISTISSGELLFTEFEGSDAGVEKQLGDKLLSYIDARFFIEGSGRVSGGYVEAGAENTSGDGYVEAGAENTSGYYYEGAGAENAPGYGYGGESAENVSGYGYEEAVSESVSGYEPEEADPENVYNYESEERLAGNELTYSSGSLRLQNVDYITIMGALFFMIVAIILIRLIVSAGRAKKAAEISRKRRKKVNSSVWEEPTERLAGGARSSGETMLLFAEEL